MIDLFAMTYIDGDQIPSIWTQARREYAFYLRNDCKMTWREIAARLNVNASRAAYIVFREDINRMEANRKGEVK